MAREHTQIDRVQGGLAKRVFGLPWQPNPPVGLAALSKLTA
jgi:arsenite-transporting ATPase